MNTVFDHRSYKTYLCKALEKRSNKSAGQKSRLAEALRCHNTYISQVLGGNSHFSLEQGELTNNFLGHTKDESTYFLFLIQFERAGTSSLKKFFEEELDRLKEKRLLLKDRFKYQRALSEADQLIYYSHWVYSAIHVLVSVPDLNSVDGLSKYLGISLSKTNEVLEFLASIGLLSESHGKYKITSNTLHIGQDSQMIRNHHCNWRMKSMMAISDGKKENLHYSAVITISKKDSLEVRELLVNAIEKIRCVIKDSKDEAGFCYNIDFFNL